MGAKVSGAAGSHRFVRSHEGRALLFDAVPRPATMPELSPLFRIATVIGRWNTPHFAKSKNDKVPPQDRAHLSRVIALVCDKVVYLYGSLRGARSERIFDNESCGELFRNIFLIPKYRRIGIFSVTFIGMFPLVYSSR